MIINHFKYKNRISRLSNKLLNDIIVSRISIILVTIISLIDFITIAVATGIVTATSTGIATAVGFYIIIIIIN